MTEDTVVKTKGPAPDGKVGDTAAWLKKVTPKDVNAKTFEVFEISDGPKGGPKQYGSMYANKYGHQITGKQACEIFRGNAVEVTMTGDKGDYKAVLFPAERDVRVTGENGQYKTIHQEVGRAFYRTTKPTAEKPTSREFGYQVPDPSEFDKNAKTKKAMVNFFMEYTVGVVGKNGGPQKTVEIDPGQAYRMLKGETLRFPELGASGATLKVSEVAAKEGGKYRDAKLEFRFNDLSAEIGAWEQATGLKYEPKDKVEKPNVASTVGTPLAPEEEELSEEPAIRA